MNAVEITASVTAIGNALACQFSDDQLILAAAVFTQLGDTLATISAIRGICSDNQSSNTERSGKTSVMKSTKEEASIPDDKDDTGEYNEKNN